MGSIDASRERALAMMEHSADPGSRMPAFYETLRETLPVKSRGDLTCYRRLAEWLAQGIREQRFNEEIYCRVILPARESGSTAAKNPRAVFVAHLLKKSDCGGNRV